MRRKILFDQEAVTKLSVEEPEFVKAALLEGVRGILGDDYDIEIFEAHHRNKADAPSGTALTIAEIAAGARGVTLADVAIQRIRSYAGSPPAFDTVSELEAYFRTVYKPYVAMDDAQWRRLSETSTRRRPLPWSAPTGASNGIRCSRIP